MHGAPKRAFWIDERAAVGAEFALVMIPFLTLVFAILGLSFMLYAASTLHYATEDAARCYAVKTLLCSDNATTQDYALTRYKGPNISPVFVASTGGCGHTVTGTGTVALDMGLVNLSVPLSASACYP